jgi:cell division protein FtsW
MFASLKSLFKRSDGFSPKRLEADTQLYIIVGILVLFGLIMLASASSIVAYNSYQDTYYFFKRQLISIIIGAAAFWVFSKIDYRA